MMNTEPVHRKRLQHFNSLGHAHELTFSCYRRSNFLKDEMACELLQEEIENSRRIYSFRIWAYVFMPNHVHLLLWPINPAYDISSISSGVKGVMSKKYHIFLVNHDRIKHDKYFSEREVKKHFTFWQPGGGFDRNLWNAKAIHESIGYIEANPVRKNLVAAPEEWKWSSAFGRKHRRGLIPDEFNMPVLMGNPQAQSVGVR